MIRYIHLLLLLLLFTAEWSAAAPIRISPPKNGHSHPRRDRWAAPESREPTGGWTPSDERRPTGGWEPDSARRPRTPGSGWQNTPGNTWRAPRDAEAEKRRDRDRRRRERSFSPRYTD